MIDAPFFWVKIKNLSWKFKEFQRFFRQHFFTKTIFDYFVTNSHDVDGGHEISQQIFFFLSSSSLLLPLQMPFPSWREF